MDAKEKKRKRDRERYAQMSNEEKQEKLKRLHEAYLQKKKNKESTQLKENGTQGRKQYIEEKQTKQKNKKCQHDRQRYANMQPEQKKARIQQITQNKELKRSTQIKDSIALENPAYIEPEPENPAYIEPELEVRTSTFDLKQRKHVTPGERQTLLQRRNEEFTRKIGNIVVSSKEETSKMKNGDNDEENPQLPEAIINGNTIIYTVLLHYKTIYNFM
jgi:hypothetical protein